MNRTAPSTLIAALALLVLLGVALAAGCTTTSSGSTATKTPPRPAPPPPARSRPPGRPAPDRPPSPPSAIDRLIPFIPKTAGAWKLDGDAQGMTMKDGEGQDYTWVTGEYIKDGDDNAKANHHDHGRRVANTPFKEQWSVLQEH